MDNTEIDKDAEDAIEANIGEWLALGFDDTQIINELQAGDFGLEEQEAQRALKRIYNHWQNTREVMDLRLSDRVEWHIFLRKRILQKTMASESPSALRVALAVLDSLATIQGVVAAPTQPVPLQVVLKEKAES